MSSGQPDYAERRKHRRVKRGEELVVFEWRDAQGAGVVTKGKLQDISAGGIAAHIETQLPPAGVEGTATVHFEVVRVTCPVVVARTWEGGAALEFLDTIPETIDDLESLA